MDRTCNDLQKGCDLDGILHKDTRKVPQMRHSTSLYSPSSPCMEQTHCYGLHSTAAAKRATYPISGRKPWRAYDPEAQDL